MESMNDSPPSRPRTGRRLTNAQLSELYPKPKTYEQQRAVVGERRRRQLARRGHWPALNIAIRLFVVMTAFALLLRSAPAIIFTNILAGVFGMAFLAMVLLGVAKWQAGGVSDILDKFGLNASGFLLLYFTVIGPLLGGVIFGLSLWSSGMMMVGGYAVAFVLHLAVIRWLFGWMRTAG